MLVLNQDEVWDPALLSIGDTPHSSVRIDYNNPMISKARGFWSVTPNIGGNVIKDLAGTNDFNVVNATRRGNYIESFDTSTVMLEAGQLAYASTGIFNFYVKTDNLTNATILLANSEYSDNNGQTQVFCGPYTGAFSDESVGFYMSSSGSNRLVMHLRKGSDLLMDGRYHSVSIIIDAIDNRMIIDGKVYTESNGIEFATGSATEAKFTNTADSEDGVQILSRTLSSSTLGRPGKIKFWSYYTSNKPTDREIIAHHKDPFAWINI